MAMKKKPRAAKAAPPDLREACVAAARAAIAEEGLENLSLRDVARRLGVSHQAPYKHFPSRDALLAEVMRRCFAEFAAHLDGRKRSEVPMEDLGALGERYLSFALEQPLEYRLMFGTPWPHAEGREALLADAHHAFDILRGVLHRLHGSEPATRDRADLDALFVWTSMHGIASMLQSNVMEDLALKRSVMKGAVAHAMERICVALGGDPGKR